MAAWLHDETLGTCPVCGSRERTLRHAALRDDSYRAVDGQWPLWRCAGCGCAYLDPRPDRASIGLAYRGYYTHGGSPDAPAPAAAPSPSWRGRLRGWAEQAYLQRRYGAPGKAPAARLGAALFALLPAHRRAVDVRLRHLPGPGRGRRLLDVGCGDGGFLRLARDCGWQVEGVEPDPQAAAAARRHGVPVHTGGLEACAGRSACFDLVTMSHVLEHLHDPVAALADCHRLLGPGGRLWLATPNIDSLGHAAYGPHWRGLEAPRHLVLFDEAGLRRLLQAAGFQAVRRHAPAWGEPFVLARASHAMRLGRHPHDAPPPLPPALQRAAWRAALAGLVRPSRREFHYLSARR
jgi:2-polyprenyl-3-methyl-5-hydroxy-6-metoxy-1,4-benzoquinol methylase